MLTSEEKYSKKCPRCGRLVVRRRGNLRLVESVLKAIDALVRFHLKRCVGVARG